MKNQQFEMNYIEQRDNEKNYIYYIFSNKVCTNHYF